MFVNKFFYFGADILGDLLLVATSGPVKMSCVPLSMGGSNAVFMCWNIIKKYLAVA